MLRLLAYGYAIQEFESEGIALGCEKDFDFRALNDGRAVKAQDLIKFRRGNRPLIEAVLEKVFRAAAERGHRFQADEKDSVKEDSFLKEARRRLDIARHFDTAD